MSQEKQVTASHKYSRILYLGYYLKQLDRGKFTKFLD